MTKEKPIEEIYQKKTQLEHILLRPDTYIGSVEKITTPMWVFKDNHMVYKNITYVPGFYKIFDEIIVNAADNKVRDPNMDTIKVSIDRENNSISVLNNGRGIPIEIHSKEQVYVPELIFGHLLTSSNYNDNEKKVTGGRNGYGAKLCNIFSIKFIVETADTSIRKKFKQVFSKNMSAKTAPIITDYNRKQDFTYIHYFPDLSKFGMTCIDDDTEALLKKRVYDLAGCINGVKVYLNDERIKIKNFKEYVDTYLSSKTPIVYERVNGRWEIAITISDGQFNQVSFVNSICTSKGGTHVNHITEQLTTALIEAIKKKDKKNVPLKPFQVKNHIWVFVNAQIENPAFDSQTKETMTLRASQFGSKCELTDTFLKKVLKLGIIENVLAFTKIKQDQILKKSDGNSKTSRISGLTKLDDANNAGTRKSAKCTLILTEGDSAKTLAVSGLSVIGRDNYGVFPLRGKLLNAREATTQQITQNAEISAIKQILGLQHGKEYKDVSTLRYGHLMIMTDQDHDGSHIKGLIINFIDYYWPSLLKVPEFLLEFITPIVRCTKKGKSISFFTIPEYEKWKSENNDGKGWTIKYFKGLGTNTNTDAKVYFSDPKKHVKPFKVADEESQQLIDMAFNKKRANDRKQWLSEFKPGTYMDHSIPEIPISDFINNELILFSMADNTRSIPSCVDGLKPGQRKILFACFKRNLKSEIKVAQLAGYVAEQSAYHHGEQSLNSTITGMAQNFVGSNNLPLLYPEGQFGTRLQGGKDAASPRYIFTMLNEITRTIFHPDDDALVKYLNDDGQSIEPEWYIPIIPMILVNGSDGIGTGWSSSIPNYNPCDIVKYIKCLMNNENIFPELKPWYHGFNGSIIKESENRYRVSGRINKLDSTTVEITELPIKCWTQTYKEQLETWLIGTDKVASWIKDYTEHHTDEHVKFVITLNEKEMIKAEKEGLENRFKLTSTISTTNLVCFDYNGKIKKYENVEDIIKDFYKLRKTFYQKRKDHILKTLKFEYLRIENKVKFITEIINETLVVQNRKQIEIIEDLRLRKYKEILSSNDNSKHGYNYLLTMPIWNLTWEKVNEMKKEMKDKENEIKELTNKTIIELWTTDLDDFMIKWTKLEKK